MAEAAGPSPARREAERLLADALARPGLWPVAVAAGDEVDSIVADGPRLAGRPPREWAPEVLAAWSRGAVYLRDEPSRVSRKVSITATRLVVRGSSVGAFTCLGGDGVLLERSKLLGHDEVTGPVALVDSRLDDHVVVGPDVVALATALLPFSLLRRDVRIERSGVGSHSLVDGDAPPPPLPARGPRRTGVSVGARSWIGQQVSLAGGARLGEGVVVTSQAAVARGIPAHVVAAGAPAETFPIDLVVRGLSEKDCRREGRAQGVPAVALPVYGPVTGALVGPALLELDYPGHGVLSGLASDNLLSFHAGALEAAVAFMFPEARARVSFARGRSVRFRVELDAPPAPPSAPDRLRLWRALCNARWLAPFEATR